MNGKILILLNSIKAPWNSHLFWFLRGGGGGGCYFFFFLLTVASEKCPYRDSWSALDAATFGEKPQEEEACDKCKSAPCVHEREASFFCTDQLMAAVFPNLSAPQSFLH